MPGICLTFYKVTLTYKASHNRLDFMTALLTLGTTPIDSV
jgi:hypothetical protein